MATPRYTALSHTSSDGEGEGEENDQLLNQSSPILPTTTMTTGLYNEQHTKTYSITFRPSLLIRLISGIFSLTGAIILLILGGQWFIACDIFLLLIVSQNLLQLLYHICSSVFRIRIEYRGQQVRDAPFSLSLPSGNKRPMIPFVLCVDVVLCLALFISLMSEGSVYRGHRGRYWYHSSQVYDGVILGYIALVLQMLLVIPMLDKYTVTISGRINRPAADRRSERRDVKFAPSVATVVAATARGDQGQQQQQQGIVTNEPVMRSPADMV